MADAAAQKSGCAIAVMAKAPRPGQVKTRLVPPLTPDMASALKIDLDIIPGGAHLDGHAGYGPWPAVRDWVADRHTRMVTNR